MRYIDLDLLLADAESQSLIMSADDALQKVLDEPDPAERKKLIDENRDKWVAFRERFHAVFGQKCWYTESENPGTDEDVDHYRPKGRIAESRAHGGYWWEALSWRNFRLSSHRANRMRINPDTGRTHGKADHFPLLDEAHRWAGPGYICCEAPTLLDPTDPEDPPLLTFDTNGYTALSTAYRNDPVAHRKVEDSRIYLHLDWPAFVAARRRLYTLIYTKIADGDRAVARLVHEPVTAKETLKAIARDLIRLTRDDQPYSRAAQTYVLHYRDRDWVKRNVVPYVPGGLN
uniref:hypothetical protein n=1 Tax=Paractinoplanes polyasparticus TaxID=2856853 RepID=UPI001C85375B|nr:hypothetical protein [Actinoplanes polyasparticus]